MSTSTSVRAAPAWPDYRAIWRWHFYAGLFCIPFVIWLSLTGAIYLFKPQLDAGIDAPYEQLRVDGPRASAQAQIEAALAAVPGARLKAYELPATPQSAVRVLVGRDTALYRVYVHPQTLQVLKRVDEDQRFTRLVFLLHGELLAGDAGSALVELAACWAIVLVITGLVLWWPRGQRGLGGVLYPRLAHGRLFWRDLHAVTGFWVSVFALFLLLSGLPWAKFWGGNLKAVRQIVASVPIQQDWTTGHSAELVQRRVEEGGEHAGHHHGSMSGQPPVDLAAVDRVLPAVSALQLPPPVLIAPPTAREPRWTARSDTQNRPQRVRLLLDAQTGAVVQRENFADRKLLDRIIGTGVAAHEGQLFGWFNQLLGLLTALGLITLCISAVQLWWTRRPQGQLGAPPAGAPPRFVTWLLALVLLLGLLLPLMGASLLLVYLSERYLLRRHAPLRAFLGLQPH
ncbi:Uncharacterized iron-regulated membrane protein [Solimonas aquatica]|uniref:Uncharacterized iron-regulated membrane protein n=1 Tax=Solimonas aquatica TaxID=489703 RepID=A0A1H9FQF0_9GAMM|nr:PepSY domain-containing protein [Solimonas aquatica]SEQ40117.1 Uncharacterized iron-regulated membrane protein [Solimonas aquatica]